MFESSKSYLPTSEKYDSVLRVRSKIVNVFSGYSSVHWIVSFAGGFAAICLSLRVIILREGSELGRLAFGNDHGSRLRTVVKGCDNFRDYV